MRSHFSEMIDSHLTYPQPTVALPLEGQQGEGDTSTVTAGDEIRSLTAGGTKAEVLTRGLLEVMWRSYGTHVTE